MSSQPVHVAVAVIENDKGEILIAKRPDHLHQGGLWEFPGGKVEENETIEEALQREIHEEVGLNVKLTEPLIKILHDYPDKSVLLEVRKVLDFSGAATGKEKQEIKWVKISELDNFEFPVANHSIIKATQLPKEYMITGEFDSEEELFIRVKRAIDSGVKLIQFRAHWLDNKEYFSLAKILFEKIKSKQVKLILNRSVSLCEEMHAKEYCDGIHLSVLELKKLNKRPCFPLIAASTHNLEEIRLAEELDVDFCVLSPVCFTQSHPESEPLGWDDFSTLCDSSVIPVFALGGMKKEHLNLVSEYGAQGIAAINEYWKK